MFVSFPRANSSDLSDSRLCYCATSLPSDVDGCEAKSEHDVGETSAGRLGQNATGGGYFNLELRVKGAV